MTRQEIVQNFTLNIEKERIHLGLTQGEMARKLEMSLSGYQKMISGKTIKIDLYIVILLYELSGKWLFELIGQTTAISDMVIKLKKLSSYQQKFIGGIIDFELEFTSGPSQSKEEQYISVLELTGNMQDGMICDSANLIKYNAGIYRKRFGSDLLLGFKITSNHLHPVYHKGDILLISRSPIRDGDIGIFVNKENGRVYLRKFHQSSPCVLMPLNNYGEIILVDNSSETDMKKWILFGHVLTKVRE